MLLLVGLIITTSRRCMVIIASSIQNLGFFESKLGIAQNHSFLVVFRNASFQLKKISLKKTEGM